MHVDTSVSRQKSDIFRLREYLFCRTYIKLVSPIMDFFFLVVFANLGIIAEYQINVVVLIFPVIMCFGN
jgi:hypothetical protein